MADDGIQDLDFWFSKLKEAIENGQNFRHVPIPSHILKQPDFKKLFEQFFKNAPAITEAIKENEKKEYLENVDHGMASLEVKPLDQEISFFHTGSQSTAYNRKIQFDTYSTLLEAMRDGPAKAALAAEVNTTATSQLPHLFKKQDFYKHISGDIERSLATAISGDKKFYLARLASGKSGSVFRELAGAGDAEEEILAEDKTRNGVIERRIDNLNPFSGKFVFKTAFGAPPTASVSRSAVAIILYKDLGHYVYGAEYKIFNTSTGSLHTSSFFKAQGGSVKIDGLEHGLLDTANPYHTTASTILIQMKEPAGNITYQANWEQVYATSSTAAMEVVYKTLQPEYSYTTRNGSFSTKIHTNKTVSFNGKIVIT